MPDSKHSRRKDDHLAEAAKPAMQGHGSNGFDRIRLTHQALPELSLDEIDTSAELFGHRFSMPLMIGAMTGGSEKGDAINLILSEAASQMNVPLALGSQRAALMDADATPQKALREASPNAFLIGNLGATQLAVAGGVDLALRAVASIQANALAIHLNPLQELVQPDGDTDWRGVTKALATLVEQTDAPILVKEVGAGLSAQAVIALYEAGIRHIEIAGKGGTNWARIEQARRENSTDSLTAPFLDWGIPTLDALQAALALRETMPDLQIIASGGLRHGLDSAKTCWLGADFTAAAQPFLLTALENTHEKAVAATIERLKQWQKQIAMTCFLTASKGLHSLSTADGQIL
ncbi:MAG: type 2 isopentenyl-diphosphate Delta-isomerase [Parvibaculales bacterium]